MLSVHQLCVSYGTRTVLHQINFELQAGQALAVLGRNGAGRSTLLKAIAGQVQVHSGCIQWQQEKINDLLAFQRARAGIAWMPETKEIFAQLTTQENLLLGCGPKMATFHKRVALQNMYERYPLLAKRAQVKAGTLSGGEQQLLSFVRALMGSPQLVLLDEPTEGLAAPIIKKMEIHLLELKSQGTSIVLVEQKLDVSAEIADQCLILNQGEQVFLGGMQTLQAKQNLKNEWL